MKFTIREIVLWPRRGGMEPRRLKLRADGVNIIAGGSKTGKSAIIPIIDYCMGSDRCAIPVETIRNACSWFGIVVDSEEGAKLLARREPGKQKTTSDMHLAEGEEVTVPESAPEKNANADVVKARLDELSGLTNLGFDYERVGSGFTGRPSLRDLVAFTFQPQNIVANPDVLFFKADTYEHREKLRTVFPYVLGALSAEGLAAQHELKWIQRKREQRERELRALREVSERWAAELRAWVLKARELGLLAEEVPESVTRDTLVELLTRAVRDDGIAQVKEEGIEGSVAELVELEREEAAVDEELIALRRRLAEMSRLRASASRFGGALVVQRERLAVARWVKALEKERHECPVCGTGIEGESDVARELVEALERVEVEVKRSGSISAAFDREMVRVKRDVGVRVEKLGAIGVRKREIGIRKGEAGEARYRQSEIDRFKGRMEKGLEVYGALERGDTLEVEIDELRTREEALRRIIARDNVEARKARALEKIAILASRLLPGLDAERPDEPIELSIEDLTIRIKGAERVDYLWEIGSGANWLAYHVAVSLALQEFFLGTELNPVPSFLVYDQPSQVYFPRQLAGARARDVGGKEPVLADEDVEAVRKVFETMSGVIARSAGRLQALVLDHAGTNVWGGVEGVHLVEEWRGGRKLVPTDWLA